MNDYQSKIWGLEGALRLGGIDTARAQLAAARAERNYADLNADQAAFRLRMAQLMSRGDMTDHDESLVLYLLTGRGDHKEAWLARLKNEETKERTL